MKRQRGRNRNNYNRNNNNRSMESNGPDVKVRGNVSTIYEKYTQLARDAKTSGNRVKAESLRQHAEHYLHLMNEQEAQREARDAERQQQRNGRRNNNIYDDPNKPNILVIEGIMLFGNQAPVGTVVRKSDFKVKVDYRNLCHMDPPRCEETTLEPGYYDLVYGEWVVQDESEDEAMPGA